MKSFDSVTDILLIKYNYCDYHSCHIFYSLLNLFKDMPYKRIYVCSIHKDISRLQFGPNSLRTMITPYRGCAVCILLISQHKLSGDVQDQ